MDKIENLMGNEIIELARTEQPGSDRAREIVRKAVSGDSAAQAMIQPYLSIAREYVEKGQI